MATEVSPQAHATSKQDFGISLSLRSPRRRGKRVLVTGASTGIGWDTVVKLRARGWEVFATARREERLSQLAGATGAHAFAADLSDPAEVAALHDWVESKGGVNAIVNNAGGALGLDCVAEGKLADWKEMYDRNVTSSLLLTQAFLDDLKESGGDLLYVTSTAALAAYKGGAGYSAAKHAQSQIPRTLRLELAGYDVRVIEICPGLVATAEFGITRLGDSEKAAAMYANIDNPLQGEDIAEAIAWALELPAHVNVDQLRIRPLEQVSHHTYHRLLP